MVSRPAGFPLRAARGLRAGAGWLRTVVTRQFITRNRRLSFGLALTVVAIGVAAVHVSEWWFSPGVMILPILAGGMLLWVRALDTVKILNQFVAPADWSFDAISTAIGQTLHGLWVIDWVMQPDAAMWAALLMVQALPFFCAVVMAMISCFPHRQQPPVERIDAGKNVPASDAASDGNLANAARTATGGAANSII